MTISDPRSWRSERTWKTSSAAPSGRREIAQFVKDDELGAGVAGDDTGELAAAFGFLELVGEAGEGGEADAPSGLAGADRECRCEVGLAGAAVTDQDHRLAVVDPGSLGERGDRGRGTLGLSAKRKSSRRLICGEAGLDQAAAFAPLGALAISASSSAAR